MSEYEKRELRHDKAHGIRLVEEMRDAFKIAEGKPQFGPDYGNGPTENIGPWDRAFVKLNAVVANPEAMSIMRESGIRERAGGSLLVNDRGI